MTSQVLLTQASAEVTAFARLLRTLGTLRRELETRLVSAHGLTVTDYETLLALAQAPDGRMRRVDLAERLTLSPSGVTRLLEGLERAELVGKQHCANDQRVTWAVVTETGRRTLAAAGDVHDETMRELVGGRLEPAELEKLIELLGRLPGGDVDGAVCTAGEEQ